MKSLLVISVLLVSIIFPVIAEDEKKFTQKDVDAKVKKEVERQIDLIKKKSITQLTKELLEKERMLNERSTQLDKREEQIKMSEKSLLARIEAFEQQKKKIIGCVDDHKNKEMMRIKQLVEVVSGMKPNKAAELLSVQDAQISVKLLEKIDPVKASKIFNLMDKEVSARLQKQYLNMQQ